MIAATQPISSRTGLAPWDTTLLLTGHFRDKELTEQSHRALFPGLVEDVGVWNCPGAMWRLSGDKSQKLKFKEVSSSGLSP